MSPPSSVEAASPVRACFPNLNLAQTVVSALYPAEPQKIAQPSTTGSAKIAPNCTQLHLIAEKPAKTKNFLINRNNCKKPVLHLVAPKHSRGGSFRAEVSQAWSKLV